jgi:hypothetical protein
LSIAIIEAELRTKLAATIIDWPIRWPNEPWPANLDLTNGNQPTNNDGTPMPYVLVENLVGADTATIAPEGQRVSERLGMMRVHLVYPENYGTVELTGKVDILWMAFKRQTLRLDTDLWQRLTTMDPRIDDNAAVVETGDRFVRTVTVPWEFFYRS